MIGGVTLVCGFLYAACVRAADADPAAPAAQPAVASEPAAKPADGQEDTTSGLVRIGKDYDLWIDQKRKLVVVDGAVCLHEGQLEAFACPRGTKEHESIVAVNCKPQFVHAALLAVGAKAGSPMRWDPYKPATGTPVEILVLWVDAEGNKQKARAQEWIKEGKTGQAMTHSWVFAGSRVWTDEETKQTYYSADGGDFICVSNFPSAMLDLPIKSSQSNTELMFTAFTERIPPLKTKVRLVLMPQLDKAVEEPQKPAGKAEPPPADPAPPS
jgi:hypothetical protein